MVLKMIIQEPVQAAIWHCLNHYAYPDAVFLAERLHAEVKSDDSLYLLATAYYRSGQCNHAYAVLKATQLSMSPQCRFLLARCALELEKYNEAEAALSGNEFHQKSLDDLASEYGDLASFVLQLLAKICARTERQSKATESYKRALKINPFLWSCFADLCNQGEKLDPVQIFQLSSLDNLSACGGSLPLDTIITSSTPSINNTTDVTGYGTPTQILQMHSFNTGAFNNTKLCTPEQQSPINNLVMVSGVTPLQASRVRCLRFHNLMGGTAGISPLTPSFGVLPLDGTNSEVYPGTPPFQTTLMEANDQKSLAKRVRAHVGQFISRKESPLQNIKPVFTQSSVTNTISLSPSTPSPNLQTSQNVRRSSRLFSNSYSVKENNKSPNRGKFATPKSPSRKTKQRMAKTNLNKTTYTDLNARNREKEKNETITSDTKTSSAINSSYNQIQQVLNLQKQSAEGLMSLLRDLGCAYYNLSQFNCRKTIELLGNLVEHHHKTSWVQCVLGLAYFELADYQESVRYFSHVHKMEPYRLQHMETFSTALWHLQKEVSLSALAQDLTQLDKDSPITWCVTGNCFSLHKEHDTAIKFFQRAVQVDPSFPYAYTLLGHEYIMTEELDKAMSCFRNAIRLDSRHYNAWFGIGTIYSKQERFHLAEINYARALSINPNNSVIMCHIGVVQHALKKTEKALQTLNTAINNDPKNPLCKFHRGSIYFAIGRHAEALKELEELKEIVPKESLVYYLIGKVHRKLGNNDLALMHFSWATDLDPKGASSQIKEAFDPAIGRSHTDDESPQSPTCEDFPSETTSLQQQEGSQEALSFGPLPEDSDDSL